MKKTLYLSLIAVLGVASVDMVVGEEEESVQNTMTQSAERQVNELEESVTGKEKFHIPENIMKAASPAVQEEVTRWFSEGELAAVFDSFSKLSLKDIELIATALKQNPLLEELSIYSFLGDEGVKMIAEALKDNKIVKKVTLNFTLIGNDGAKAMADMLKTNKTIITLDLEENDIGDEGARALVEAWGDRIGELKLVGNAINDSELLLELGLYVSNRSLASKGEEMETDGIEDSNWGDDIVLPSLDSALPRRP